jgi:NADPH:quinone reductase-like Zn-dependent oxidoreductase
MTESSIPVMMRAAYVEAPGTADAIRVGELPVPRPGPTDVLVRVQAVALDPVDTIIRAGRYHTPIPLPFIVGRDLVGTVAEVGSPALGFAVGERVWCNSLGHDGRQGSFAEYGVVPVERLYRLPNGMDPEVVVAVAHPAATAYLAWFVHARLQPGETVYVGGAGGNVGMAALEMGVLVGARVIAGARPADHERCLAAGATAAVDFGDPHLGERLAELAPDGLDIVWDTSGHHELIGEAGLLAPGARVVVTAARRSEFAVPLKAMYQRDASVIGFVLSRASARQLSDAAALINRMLSDGTLTTRISERLPLGETAAVHRRIEAGDIDGRVLLYPDRA